MKTKTLFILLLITATLTACAQSNTYKVTGQIDNVVDGAVVELHTVEGTSGRLFKSDTLRNGSFSFEGEIDSLRKFMLVAKWGEFASYFRPLWIKPGSNTKISGENYSLFSWKIESNVKEQQEEDKYIEIHAQFPELDSLLISSNELINRRANLSEGKERDNVIKQLDAIRLKTDSMYLIYDSTLYSFMQKEPVSIVWIERLKMYSMKMLFDKNYKYADELKRLYERLSPEQKKSEEGQTIYRQLYPFTVIQEKQPMAEGLFFDPQNNQREITQYKGNYLLLDFWSVSCAPCIAAFSEMKEIHEQHANKLTIISISLDEKEIWKNGMERHQLPWVNLNDFKGISGYAARYGVHGIPFYVLISPDGIVQKIWSGYKKGLLKEKLKDVF